MVEVKLLPLDEAIANNLETEPVLGGPADRGQNGEAGEFVARIHDRPIALSARDLLAKGKATPVAKLYDRFDLWLVPHRFSIFRVAGSATVTSAGCEIEYIEDGRTMSVVSVFPTSEFIKSVDANLVAKFAASLNEKGLLEVIAATASLSTATLPGSKALSASVNVAGSAKIELSMSVKTPVVNAVGVGSRHCIFEFKRKKMELVGDDIETWAVVALPKRTETIRYKMRCWFDARKHFASRPWMSDWVEVEATKSSAEA